MVPGADQVAAQFPLGQAVRFGSVAAVDPGAGAADAGLPAGADAADRGVRGGVFSSEFVEPGQGGFREPQPGRGFPRGGRLRGGRFR